MKENDYLKKFVATNLLLWFGRHDVTKGGRPLTSKLNLSEKQNASRATLERDGIQILPGYYSATQCAALRAKIDSIMAGARGAAWVDDQKSDHRANAAKRVSPEVAALCDDPFIVDIARALSKREVIPRFALAARREHKDGGKGSGGGWHRDSPGFQFKAMLYLSAVTIDNGPFQYFRRIHKRLYQLRDYFVDLSRGYADRPRYSDERVARLPQNDLVTATGKAGDLMLFNSTGVHRGMPTRAGARYALTIYFFNKLSDENWEKQLIARPSAAPTMPGAAS